MKYLLFFVLAGVCALAGAYVLNNTTAKTPLPAAPAAEVAYTQDTMAGTTTAPKATPNDARALETALVAGGCFWCVEADLEKLPGVSAAVSGYAGGTSENPTYATYAAGGHREVVQITYDPRIVSFEEILIYAIKHMDPTDGEGSFGDRGVQYAPALYYGDTEQKHIIESLIASINAHGPYDAPLAVSVLPLPSFFAAEEYHQDYASKPLSALQYRLYRRASGRDAFIRKHWGNDTDATLPWREQHTGASAGVHTGTKAYPWSAYEKPARDVLRGQLDSLTFNVTQENGTERAGSSPLDAQYERGIYVDVLSGEPLFSSRDKFDSGTGWPSFTQPITPDAVTEHDDWALFVRRTEIRSAIADNHLGHVFTDGPRERGGLRYCMNGVALRFVPEANMAAEGYGDFLEML